MILSAKGISAKMIRLRLRIPPLTWFSLPRLRGMALGLTGCLILMFSFFWYPAYVKFQTAQTEKGYWHSLLSSELVNDNFPSGTPVIPSIDQLPELIEECCRTLAQKGVGVMAFNVERFGDSQASLEEAELDYALVRIRLQGPWQGVESGLRALEETQQSCIHVQEVNLVSGGGETLLQVYFCSGETKS